MDVLYAKGKFITSRRKGFKLYHPWHRVLFIVISHPPDDDVYEGERAKDYITGAIEHALDTGMRLTNPFIIYTINLARNYKREGSKHDRQSK